MPAEQNAWSLPQSRAPIKTFSKLYELDRQELETLEQFLNGPKVEITYDLNDETDYAVPFVSKAGVSVCRISDTVTINGVRWHLVPGKNLIPKPVYEFLMQCPEQRRRIAAPQAEQFTNLGHFTASRQRISHA